MQSQSKAFKHLAWLYRQRLHRMNASVPIPRRVLMRVHGEMLPPRLLMSVSSAGSETLVNTTTSASMALPAIAMNPAGNSVVVWSTSSSGGQVLGQRYNINGTRMGSQFLVDQNPTGSAAAPSVAIDDVGDFVVVWAKGSSVYARVFSSAGTAVTGDTLVTSSAVGSSRPVVGMDAGGAFTVVWQGSGSADSNGIYKRQFLVSGVATASAVVVNSTFAGAQINPAIAIDSAGDAIIAWTDTSTSASTVQAAYFAASGSTITQFAAGAESGDAEDNASVGINASGSFVIAWQTDFGILNPDDITARAFSSSATPLTANPFVVNSFNLYGQTNPSVAERADGSFLISFTSQYQDLSGTGVYAQAYNSAGTADGGEFQVNSTWLFNQQDSAAAWAGGNAIIVWDGNGNGDSAGVFLQRYTASGNANQAPVNSVPTTQAIYENNSLSFTMSVSDADALGGVEQLTLTATNGTLALSTASNLIFSSGSNNTATMTFTGTLASINAALSGAIFTPATNFVGSAQVQIVANDLGNTGVGGPTSATSSFTINVNSPPTADTVPGAQTTLENVPLVFAPQNDNSVYAGSASVAAGLSVASGTLTLSTTSGLSFINGTANGSSNVQISGTVANINAALDGLTFTPAANFTGSDPLTYITANSAANLTSYYSTYSIPLTVTAPPPPVNQPPVIAKPGTQTTDENVALTLGGGNALSVADADANGNAEQLTLTATNGTLTLSGTSGLTFSTGTGTDDSSATFTGTLANINAALNGLTFIPASGIYGSGAIYAAINDLGNTGTGGEQTAVATLGINIIQVNQPPAIAIPPSQTTPENGELDFSSANSNAITLSDVDDNGASEKLTLASTNGTLLLRSTNGLTFNAGGSGQSSMTISGTLTNLNAALDTLAFEPTTNFFGTASIQLLLNDLGNTGTGGDQTAVSTLGINITQVNQPPAVAVPPTQTASENVALDFSSANSNAIALSDVDDNGASEQLTLTSTHGTLLLGSTNGLTFSAGGSGQFSMTISATLANLNAALNGLAFVPTTNFFGSASIQLLLNDLGNTGLGGAKTASGTINVNVNPVAHTPSVTNAVSNLGQITQAGLVISTNSIDAGLPIYFEITNITGGALFESDRITPIHNGEFLTAAQGLAGLKFQPSPLSLVPGSFDVQASLTPSASGLGGSVVDATIQVTAPTAPVNTVRLEQSVLENATLVFSQAGGNAITVSNIDNAVQRLILTATNGTIALAASTGNASLILSGTPALLTAELDGLTFMPTNDYLGAASLQIVSTDAQSIALGNPLSAMSSISILVIPTPTPVLLNDNGLSMQSGASAAIASSQLDAVETGLSSDELTFTITQAPKFGQILLAGAPLGVGGSFTQDDIDHGRIAYASASGASNEDDFKFVVTDQAGTALPTAVFTIHSVGPTPTPPTPATHPTLPTPSPSQPQQTQVPATTLISLVPDIQNTKFSQTTINVATASSEVAVVSPPLAPPSGDTPVTPPALATPKAQAAPAPAHAATPPRPAAPAAPASDNKPPKDTAGSNSNTSNNAPLTLKANQKLWQDLDIMQQRAEVEHEAHVRIVAGSATLVSAGMSVMYFVWAIRAGSILSSLLSSMPAWNLVDPLPILNQAAGEDDLGEPESDEDEETLESMVEQPRRRAA